MNATPERIERALDDVVAVEEIAPAMARVITWSDVYTVDARGQGCTCPDKKYNLDLGEHCKHHIAAALAFNDSVPVPFDVTENLDRRVATDGGRNTPKGHDDWTVFDPDNDNARHFESRTEADEAKEKALDAPGIDTVEVYPPGESPESLYSGGEPEVDPEKAEADPVELEHDDSDVPESDGGVVEDSPTPQTPRQSGALEDLGESIGEDPLDILPGYMITHVDGQPSLNKRGVSVLAYHYGITVTNKETVVYPHETEYQSAVIEIEVESEDGRTFVGVGEAHVDETPKHQLLRMAETRAYKRAVIFSTGTGIVGYQEVMEELQ